MASTAWDSGMPQSTSIVIPENTETTKKQSWTGDDFSGPGLKESLGNGYFLYLIFLNILSHFRDTPFDLFIT